MLCLLYYQYRTEVCSLCMLSVFLDDHWQGSPSEEAFPCSPRGTGTGRCAGLPPTEIDKMNRAWQHNVEVVESAIVEKGGFSWQSFRCIDGSNLQVGGGHCRAPTPHKGAACANFLRASCATNSFVQLNAVQYTISHEFTHDYSALTLNNFELDLGIFLTSRGNFSWLGYGWLGCGCDWSNDGKMPCNYSLASRLLHSVSPTCLQDRRGFISTCPTLRSNILNS